MSIASAAVKMLKLTPDRLRRECAEMSEGELDIIESKLKSQLAMFKSAPKNAAEQLPALEAMISTLDDMGAPTNGTTVLQACRRAAAFDASRVIDHIYGLLSIVYDEQTNRLGL